MSNIVKFISLKLNRYIDERLPKYFVANTFMASCYYFFLSPKFKREQFAVLKGKVNHLKEIGASSANLYSLVRNVHRIEKGLLMRERREVFGLEFISETIDAFEKNWSLSKMNEDAQYKWFYDVLNKYFEVSGNHKIISLQKIRFRNIIDKSKYVKDLSRNDIAAVPYLRELSNDPIIKYEDFYKLTRQRRSVRWFSTRKVSRDIIDKAILAANQSPSACNRQPFQYRVIDDPELLVKMSNLPNGIRGYADNIPVMIVVVGNLDAYFDERDRHVIYIDASLANMSFMLALETLGLSSCAINWPDIEVKELQMDKLLKLKPHQRALMCMAIGYPDPNGLVAYSEKRNIEAIRIYN